jgi:hypothetical protein
LRGLRIDRVIDLAASHAGRHDRQVAA